MASIHDESPPDKKRKKPIRKGPNDVIKKTAVVLREGVVFKKEGTDEVFMPTTITMSNKINPDPELRKEISFTKSMKPDDVKEVLKNTFPVLADTERFYCAKAVQKEKLDFCGERCIWSGEVLNREIKGHSVLYIYCEEVNNSQHTSLIAPVENMQISRNKEKMGDSGHYSSDSDLSDANSSGNCLVTEASQGHKRLRREPSTAAEGPCVIDKETFMEVESQKWGTMINNDRSYMFGDQLDNVKINSTPHPKQARGVRTCSTTQVTEKEARVSAVTVERQQHQCSMLSTSDTEEEQIQVSDQFSTDPEESGAHTTLPPVCSNTSDVTKMVPMTLPLALQPTLPTGDLTEQKQRNSSTLLSQLKSLDISGKDKEFQKSPEQRLTHSDTFPAKGNLSGQPSRQPRYLRTQVSAKEGSVSAVAIDNQQDTPVTEGASDDQIIELITSFGGEIHTGLSSQWGGANSADLIDVENIKEWLKQYDYEVFINPTESPLQGGGPCIFTFKPELPSDVNVKATFGNLEPNILEKTSLGYICTIPASPEMTPDVIPVLLMSTATGKILAGTLIEYCVVKKEGICQTIQRITSDPNLQRILLLLYMQSNLGGKPGACGSGRRGDGNSDGGASGGGASGGGAYGGGSSGEGASGSGAIGDGSSATGVSGCGSSGCGAYGGGATGCQYSRDASQPGSDVVNELCELLQKCSVCIWRQNLSVIQNKACTEDREDLEDDQLSCSQQSSENYFADTEEYSSFSSESDSALSDSEKSMGDSSLSFPWANAMSSKSQEAIPKTESTQHLHKAVHNELDVNHDIPAAMTEGFTDEPSIVGNKYVENGDCPKGNTPSTESKKSEEIYEKDDHNEKQHSSQECALYSEESTSHTLLVSRDNTLVLCVSVPALTVGNEESQYQDDELFKTPHTENAETQRSESILSITSNQQSATHAGPVTRQTSQSPMCNSLWNGTGEGKLNMASPQFRDEEIHPGQEGEESGLARWFGLCENEDAGKNEPSRWQMSSMEPNKTEEDVEKDVFDSEQDLSQKQDLFSEEGNSHIPLSSRDDSSVQNLVPEVENKNSQIIGDTSIIEAAKNGYTDTVRLLIVKGADVNQRGRGDTQDTPLTAAAKNGHTDIVRLLIENGADVNKEEWCSGDTPIFAAAKNGHTDIVRLLTENGADVKKANGCSGDTPLTAAGKNCHTDVVKLLIENGADVNKVNVCSGVTPLTAAAKNGHTDIVKLLTENGADVNKENRSSGDTPLTAAAKNGHSDIVSLLIENGADVNKEYGSSGDTPLTAAAKNGHSDIVRLLIENGADVNKQYRT